MLNRLDGKPFDDADQRLFEVLNLHLYIYIIYRIFSHIQYPVGALETLVVMRLFYSGFRRL